MFALGLVSNPRATTARVRVSRDSGESRRGLFRLFIYLFWVMVSANHFDMG